MTRAEPLVFSRLFLPLPLNLEQVVEVMERLASDPQSNNVVFESRASEVGIVHLLGAAPTQIQHLRRLLGGIIPGTVLTGLDGYVRADMQAAGRLAFTPTSLPLEPSDPDRVIRALYTAFSTPFRKGEGVVLQITLGAGHAPVYLPKKVGDPTQPWPWAELAGKARDAEADVRGRMRSRAHAISVEVTIRVGVSSADRGRRTHFAEEVESALRLAQGPSTKLVLVREPTKILNAPTTKTNFRSSMRASDVAIVSGLPIAEDRLPGMPALHPKMLRASAAVEANERIFATSTFPGDNRAIGQSIQAVLRHTFVMAPTGAGKSTLLQRLIHSDLEAGRPAVIIDPKAQLVDAILETVPDSRVDDIVVIDPTDTDRPTGFNVLDLGNRDPDVVAEGVLAVFARSFADSWGPRTADIYSASLRTLTRAAKAGGSFTLLDLVPLWTDATFRHRVLARIDDDPGLASFWSAYEALSPAAQANWIASPLNKLRSVALKPAAVKILGQAKSNFRLRDAFREGKVVLVALNEGLIGPQTAELLGNLIISELWLAIQERAADKNAAASVGVVYIDEADRFMNTGGVSLADALARSRSLGVGWVLAVQHWEQLPREMKAAAKSNMRSKIVWALESDDDARLFARLAPDLEPLDLMSLPPHHVYATTYLDGEAASWASAQTLPPLTPYSDADHVRARSRELYGPSLVSNAKLNDPPYSVGSDAGTHQVNSPGRKRRQQ